MYVTRADGTSTGWEFPSYGDGLPHDMCHLVVEDGLGLSDGFWGLIDRHVDVGLVDEQATLMRDGTPLVEQPGVDLSGLIQAEQAVAMLASPAAALESAGGLAVARLGSSPIDAAERGELARQLGFRLPDGATPDAVAAISERLGELAQRWRGLEDGGAIKLGFFSGGSKD